MKNDVIFAPITAVGGAVSVIRISGNDLSNLSLIIPEFKKLTHRKATVISVFDNDSNIKLDSVLSTYFVAPNSFTGENVAEISLHGSSYIVKRFCELLVSKCLFRWAKEGEFSKKAFLNGKIDLIQAEGINNLIRSKNFMQHKIATSMFDGSVGKKYSSWRQKLLEIMALLEVNVDFPEDDIPIETIEIYKNKIIFILNDIENHFKVFEKCKVFENGLNICLIGETNAGKSSLINALLRDDFAIVSDSAGTTRDVLSKEVNIGGININLSDTAGIRLTDDKVESEGIKRALRKVSNADIKLFITVDENVKVIDNDLVSVSNLDFIVLNKIDLHNDSESIKKSLSNKYNCNVIDISAKNNLNIDKLINILSDTVKNNFVLIDDPVIISERQKLAMEEVLFILKNIQFDKPIELLIEDMKIAIDKLGFIIGNLDNEDVLDIIFGKFCIGK